MRRDFRSHLTNQSQVSELISPANTYVGCRSKLCLARSYRLVVRGSAWPAASWTSLRLAPASR